MQLPVNNRPMLAARLSSITAAARSSHTHGPPFREQRAAKLAEDNRTTKKDAADFMSRHKRWLAELKKSARRRAQPPRPRPALPPEFGRSEPPAPRPALAARGSRGAAGDGAG